MLDISDAARALDRDLEQIFGTRLHTFVVLPNSAARRAAPTPSLAIVERLSADDLTACAARVAQWHDAGLATPIVLTKDEFARSLDTFPIELGAMIANHAVVRGHNPFTDIRIDPQDLRRACERQARSHLIHLREGYLEARGYGHAIAELIARSAAPLGALLQSVARLEGTALSDVEAAARHVERANALPDGSLTQVVRLNGGGTLSAADARRLFPPYLQAVEQLTTLVDQWSRSE